MNKVEFVDSLRRSISAVGDYNFINETVEYYQSYIETEVRKGKSEAEVLSELGDPKLIAKSILASKGIGGAGVTEEEKTESPEGDKVTINTRRGKQFVMPLWMIKGLGIATIVGVVALLGLIIKALWPIIFVGAAAVLIYKFIRDNF